MTGILIAEHFAPIAAPFDVVLCDVWGVIHNGMRPFAPAVACLEALRAAGKRIVLISNSPRPSPEIPGQFRHIGVSLACYDAIVTSGDTTRAVIAHRSADVRLRVHHIGPARDLPLFDGLNVALVDAGEADLVVCSGLTEDDHETPADYEAALGAIAERGTEFLCANPDKVVQRGDRLIYCAGALAERLEEMGGHVLYPGKPHAPIYDLALEVAGGLLGRPVPKERVIAVGDGLGTDILGAERFGIASLLVLDGIHGRALLRNGRADPEAVARMCREAGVKPLAAMAGLVL